MKVGLRNGSVSRKLSNALEGYNKTSRKKSNGEKILIIFFQFDGTVSASPLVLSSKTGSSN